MKGTRFLFMAHEATSHPPLDNASVRSIETITRGLPPAWTFAARTPTLPATPTDRWAHGILIAGWRSCRTARRRWS